MASEQDQTEKETHQPPGDSRAWDYRSVYSCNRVCWKDVQYEYIVTKSPGWERDILYDYSSSSNSIMVRLFTEAMVSHGHNLLSSYASGNVSLWL